jgi:hypothetical protein
MTADQTAPDGVRVPGTGRHIPPQTLYAVVTLTWTNGHGGTLVNTASFPFTAPGREALRRSVLIPEILNHARQSLGAPDGAPVLFLSLERDAL